MAQITIDFSTAGIADSVKSAGKVIGYHIVTDAVLFVGAYLDNVSVTSHNSQQVAIAAGAIALLNAGIKFLKDWLGTEKAVVTPIALPEAPVDDQSAFAV